MTRRGGSPKDGYVTVTMPGESTRLPLRYFNFDEGTALNVARSKALTWASRSKEAVTVYVRDELESVYCRVEKDDVLSIVPALFCVSRVVLGWALR